MKGEAMRYFLFFIIMPLFLLGQVPGEKFTKEKLIYPASNSGFFNSNSSLLQHNVFAYKFSKSVADQTQDSKFLLNSKDLDHLERLRKNLRLSFYFKYGANLLGVIGSVKTYNYFTSENEKVRDDRLYDLTKITRSMHLINFLNYSLEFQSLNSFRHAGKNLFILSEKLPKENSFELFEASNNLKKAGTYGLISQALGIVGSSMTFYALGQDPDADNFEKGLTIGGIFSLTSLIFKYISVNNIGNAGENSQKFSQYLESKWQKEYFFGFANNLKKYEEHWKTGLTLTISSIGMIVGASFISEPTPARIILYLGGISMFVGNIYMNWVAPFKLSDAADNLSGLNRELQSK